MPGRFGRVAKGSGPKISWNETRSTAFLHCFETLAGFEGVRVVRRCGNRFICGEIYTAEVFESIVAGVLIIKG